MSSDSISTYNNILLLYIVNSSWYIQSTIGAVGINQESE